MLGDQQVVQDALFYEFSLERHVPVGHMLRAIDRFADLDVAERPRQPDHGSAKWPHAASLRRSFAGRRTRLVPVIPSRRIAFEYHRTEWAVLRAPSIRLFTSAAI